jgi:tetratricopeptide (TPR) repeat protein
MSNNNNTNTYIYILIQCLFTWVLTSSPTASYAQDKNEIQIANEYFLNGQKEKALASYQALAKNVLNIPSIHNNYLSLLLDLNMFKEAENYVERAIQKLDDRLSYKLDLGYVYVKAGDIQKADKYFKNSIKSNAQDIYKLKSISDFLASRHLIDYAILSLQEARKTMSNSNLFTLELANLYRVQGKRDEMVQEYLNYVTQTPGNINYIKNLLQVLLSKPEELEALERLLYDKVQQNPESEVFSDLLIWVNLQQKNFYGAFVQSRAYDKRFKRETIKTLEIANIALNNKDYDNADKGFSFVVKEFANTESYLPARLGQIHAREAKVKRKFPVNKDSVNYLIGEYKGFISKYPENPNSFEAQMNEALLHAYYLDQKDSSIVELQNLIANTRVSPALRSRAKLELGDIYLLKEEPWESTLLYSQVEKSQKDALLGYEAKLRNAKLSYYRGDFRLAQEHLDILKEATTREIANDAMDLSMRIKENTALDTVGIAMKLYAAAELDLVQNKLQPALEKLDQIEKEFPHHSLTDDVYWLRANLKMKEGKFEEAISFLQKILIEFGEDVLADDALFTEGDIYEIQLKDKEKAMEIYRSILDKFPGSVYAAEARKRYRHLRGDFADLPNQ